MNIVPAYTRVFRRRSASEHCQAQVVILRSTEFLSGTKAREWLESTTHYPAEEFEEIHQEPDTGIVLDTWDPDIEHMKPCDMDFDAVKTYREWWKEELLTPSWTPSD